jgi:hypothetical protein
MAIKKDNPDGEDKYGYSNRAPKLGKKGDPRLTDDRDEVRAIAQKARKKADALDKKTRLKAELKDVKENSLIAKVKRGLKAQRAGKNKSKN